jgi:phospholipid-binding lipoprotein MlaA
MIPLRKKVERLSITASFLILLVIGGCTHGKGAAVHASATDTPANTVITDQDPAASADSPPGLSEVALPPGDKPAGPESVTAPGNDVGTSPEGSSAPAPPEDDSSKGPSAATTDPGPPAAVNGGDDFDEFFDDSGSAPVKADSVTAVEALVPDPLIKFNRAMFQVNDRLYFWFLKPVAKGYKKVTPGFFRKGVSNFFHNLGTPVRLVSSVLQGKIKGAGSELGRFLVNTTLGVGGVWDPADKFFGLKSSEEDLGQTLGSYRIGNGFYIVWPVLGPSTARDTVGLAGDFFLNPLYYLEPSELAWGLSGLDTVNNASFMIGDYETVKSTYMDPYVMIRDFYIEHRKKKISE